MKRFKWIWVLGICVALFLGPLGTLDLSGQEQEYVWKAKGEVRAPIKESVNKWIGEGNAKLEMLIKNLKEWDEATIKKELPNIKKEFCNTYLKSPILELDLGVRLGWEEIIWELDRMAKDVQIGPTEVEAMLLPEELQKKMEMDYRMKIATHLLLGPDDPILRGCGLHRNICTPIECQ